MVDIGKVASGKTWWLLPAAGGGALALYIIAKRQGGGSSTTSTGVNAAIEGIGGRLADLAAALTESTAAQQTALSDMQTNLGEALGGQMAAGQASLMERLGLLSDTVTAGQGALGEQFGTRIGTLQESILSALGSSGNSILEQLAAMNTGIRDDLAGLGSNVKDQLASQTRAQTAFLSASTAQQTSFYQQIRDLVSSNFGILSDKIDAMNPSRDLNYLTARAQYYQRTWPGAQVFPWMINEYMMETHQKAENDYDFASWLNAKGWRNPVTGLVRVPGY